jgi:hypothetical protein
MDELRVVGDDIYFDEFKIGSLRHLSQRQRALVYRAIQSFDRDRLHKERCRGYNEGFASGYEAHSAESQAIDCDE